MFLLILLLISNPGGFLDKPCKDMAKEIIKDIDSGKIVVTNFVNVEGSERRLGVYLAKRFCNSLIEEVRKKEDIIVLDRQWGEELTLEELNYRSAFSADTLLKRLEADIAIYGTYSLRSRELEIVEIRAITTPGATIKSQAKTRVIKLNDREYEQLKKYEDKKLPTHISSNDLYFLCEPGGRKGTIKRIEVLDRGKRLLNKDSIPVGEYIKLKIELDTVPIYLYIFGWHQGEEDKNDMVSVLYPNKFDPPNPITRKVIILPNDDDFAFLTEEPPGYNWLRVIASLNPITDFALKGYFEPTATILKSFNDALRKLDEKTWEGKYVELWITENEEL